MTKVKYETFKNMAQLRELWMTCSQVVQNSSVTSTGDSLESCKIIRSNSKEALKRPHNLSLTFIHTYIYKYNFINIDENESWWHLSNSCSRRCHSLSYVEIHYEISSDRFIKGTVWRYTQSGLASSVSVSPSGSLTRMVAASGEPP